MAALDPPKANLTFVLLGPCQKVGFFAGRRNTQKVDPSNSKESQLPRILLLSP
jgi:hypothetical protein